MFDSAEPATSEGNGQLRFPLAQFKSDDLKFQPDTNFKDKYIVIRVREEYM